ncbi:MAG: hypothetical protein U0903_11540 [Planctomycetales bacterium]
MNSLFKINVAVLVVICCWTTIFADTPSTMKFLAEGKLQQGITELQSHLKQTPTDDNARLGLGITQFLHGIERMIQSFHQYGLHPGRNQIPFLRLPTPDNPNPKSISYTQLRQVFAQLLADLQQAEKTLSEIKGDVKLPIFVGKIRLDLNGDGKADPDETFWKIYARMNRQAEVQPEVAEGYQISFDTADALWLRGYCHLLMAFDEFILAHDWKESFERTAQLFFPKVDTPHKYLLIETGRRDFIGDTGQIADVIAFIHLWRFPIAEKERMHNVREHLLAMIDLSRQTWKAIAAETDDDHEWLPSPKQTSVIPGIHVTDEMIAGWGDFLNEAESLLNGKLLMPHWRLLPGKGINFKKVFEEPQMFDLVLWIQGTAATPFVEAGPITKPETWERFDRIFRGEFIGFAIWFN